MRVHVSGLRIGSIEWCKLKIGAVAHCKVFRVVWENVGFSSVDRGFGMRRFYSLLQLSLCFHIEDKSKYPVTIRGTRADIFNGKTETRSKRGLVDSKRCDVLHEKAPHSFK